MFFVLKGEIDLLAFEPVDRSVVDWRRLRGRCDIVQLTPVRTAAG